jgi:hypothetical protein
MQPKHIGASLPVGESSEGAIEQAARKDQSVRRDRLITILLVVAGMVLAFALFVAGVLWKGRASAGSPRWLSSVDFGFRTNMMASH